MYSICGGGGGWVYFILYYLANVLVPLLLKGYLFCGNDSQMGHINHRHDLPVE